MFGLKIGKNALLIILTHILFWLMFILAPFLILSGKAVLLEPSNILFFNVFIVVLFYTNYSFLIPFFLFSRKFVYYAMSLVGLIALSYFIFDFWIPESFGYAEVLRKSAPDVHSDVPLNSSGKGFRAIAFCGIIFAVGTSVKMTKRWLMNEKEMQEISEEKLNAELSYLKSQIDPHFFFNTLNNIYSLAVQKSDRAPQTIIKLSELMRYNIYEADKELVLMRDEITYINNFIELQKIRLSQNVDINFTVTGNVGNRLIEPLLFLPFIENAFKHGIDFTNHCSIDIELYISDKNLMLLVKNKNQARKETIKRKSGMGLSNIKKRLELLYKDRYMLDIYSDETIHTVKLKLVLQKLDN